MHATVVACEIEKKSYIEELESLREKRASTLPRLPANQSSAF